MARRDNEFPAREEFPLAPEEFPQPLSETEFRPPDSAAEDSPPPGTDHANPSPLQEFTPPGCGGEALPAPASNRKRRVRRMLYAAAALVLLGLLFSKRGSAAVPVSTLTVPAAQEPVYTSASDIPPAIFTSASDIPLIEPTPEPLGKEPVIDIDFFFFSHEHHIFVRMSNTDALHSVRVTVREKTLDKQVYEHYLDEEEIASGLFEAPMLSTGDYYMDNREAMEAANAWPEFELTLDAWYENEAGDGEELLTLTREPEPEMGVGLSYMRPDYSWSDYIPPDSFYVSPWEELEEIRYVINDPDAVNDPLTFSVDLSWNGRHAAPEEYEVVVEKNEYTLVDRETGTETPTVSYTRELVLRRPDWMPEEGTLHVHIVQLLASTGEKWVRDYDFEYPVRYDWES
jgi:hypothetical protein